MILAAFFFLQILQCIWASLGCATIWFIPLGCPSVEWSFICNFFLPSFLPLSSFFLSFLVFLVINYPWFPSNLGLNLKFQIFKNSFHIKEEFLKFATTCGSHLGHQPPWDSRPKCGSQRWLLLHVFFFFSLSISLNVGPKFWFTCGKK